MVTPGFIDSHSHSDSAVLTFSDMIEKIEQGITTSIGGQCGSTLAPASVYVKQNDYEVKNYGKASEVYSTFGSFLNIAILCRYHQTDIQWECF